MSEVIQWQSWGGSYFQLIPLDHVTLSLVGGTAWGGPVQVILTGAGRRGLLGSRFAQSIKWVNFPVRALLPGVSKSSNAVIPPFVADFPLDHHTPPPCPDPLKPGQLRCFQGFQGYQHRPLVMDA